jgi:regulator of sigma E protease
LYAWGEQYLPTANAKYGIVVDEVGEKVGFQNGDKILSVDNLPVENFSKVIPTVILDKAKTVQVERNGETVDVEISDEDLALLIKSKGVISPRIPFGFKIAGFSKESVGKAAGLLLGARCWELTVKIFEYFDQFRKAMSDNWKEHQTEILVASTPFRLPWVFPKMG